MMRAFRAVFVFSLVMLSVWFLDGWAKGGGEGIEVDSGGAPANARVEPKRETQWRPLFDGVSFTGWEGNREIFRIEDGAIVGGRMAEPIPENFFLCTKEEFDNFELRLKVLLKGEDPNAGVQVRSRRIPGSHEMIGYQADLGQQYWGSLYDESRRKRVIAHADLALVERVVRKGEWNEYRIRCDGGRVQLWLNGEQTVDYREEDPAIEQGGLIGLQIHSGAPSEAWYKDIEIRELAPHPE